MPRGRLIQAEIEADLRNVSRFYPGNAYVYAITMIRITVADLNAMKIGNRNALAEIETILAALDEVLALEVVSP